MISENIRLLNEKIATFTSQHSTLVGVAVVAGVVAAVALAIFTGFPALAAIAALFAAVGIYALVVSVRHFTQQSEIKEGNISNLTENEVKQKKISEVALGERDLEISHLEDQLTALEGEKEALEEALQKLKTAHATLCLEGQNKTHLIGILQAGTVQQHYQKLTEAVDRLQVEVDEGKRVYLEAKNKFELKVASLEKRIREYEKELTQKESKFREQESYINRLKEDHDLALEEKRNEIEKLRQLLEESEGLFAELSQQCNALAVKLARPKDEITQGLLKTIDELNERNIALEQKVDYTYNEGVDTAKLWTDLEASNKKVGALQKTLLLFQQQKTDLTEKLNNNQSENEIRRLNEEVAALKQQIKELTDAKDAKEKRLKRFDPPAEK